MQIEEASNNFAHNENEFKALYYDSVQCFTTTVTLKTYKLTAIIRIHAEKSRFLTNNPFGGSSKMILYQSELPDKFDYLETVGTLALHQTSEKNHDRFIGIFPLGCKNSSKKLFISN